MANKETALTTAQNGAGYMALADADFASDISEVMDGLSVSLGKIRIKSGMFEMPGDDGERHSAQEFSGVILFNHPMNMYYTSTYDGKKEPPECGSIDGKTGTGNPGGNCKECPLNQFGTGKNEKSKACKNRQRLYILREGEMIPMVFGLPTGSLSTLSKFLMAQLSKGRKPPQFVTRFTLKTADNSTGIEYAQVQFNVDRILSDEERPLVAKLAEQIKAYSKNVALDFDTVDETAETDITVDPETGELLEPLA